MNDFEAGRYERATRSWRDVWEVDPEHSNVRDYLVKAHLLLGIQAYTRGDYEPALEQCRRALEIEPDNDKARRYVDRIEEERSSAQGIGTWRSSK
jgi:tetratricopeptide (TPR) repeat protein